MLYHQQVYRKPEEVVNAKPQSQDRSTSRPISRQSPDRSLKTPIPILANVESYIDEFERKPSRQTDYASQELSIDLFTEDATLERIALAREQVLKLQQRVEHAHEVNIRTKSKSPKKIHKLPVPDIKTGKLDNGTRFNDLERVASSSPVPREFTQSQNSIHNDRSPGRINIDDDKMNESLRIEEEIMNERSLREKLQVHYYLHQQREAIKSKLVDKLSKKKNGIPSWEKVGEKPKPVPRTATPRKKRIEFSSKMVDPFSADDPVGREMPFIVGQVCL